MTTGLQNFEIFKLDTELLGKYLLIVKKRNISYTEYQHYAITWQINIMNYGSIIIIMDMHKHNLQ